MQGTRVRATVEQAGKVTQMGIKDYKDLIENHSVSFKIPALRGSPKPRVPHGALPGSAAWGGQGCGSSV